MAHLFECLKREELSFRQLVGKINNGMQENKPNNTICITRTQVETLTKRYVRKRNWPDEIYSWTIYACD